MKTSFAVARKSLRLNGWMGEIKAVNGCIYGKDRNPFKADAGGDTDKDYYKFAGQDFWNFISGDDRLYQEIIVPIDEEAKVKDQTFKDAYTAKLIEMTIDFTNEFVTANRIDWIKLVDFVSKRA